MFASDLDVYEEFVCNEATGKSNFIQEQSTQCPILSKRERIGESLVVGEEIVVGNEHLFDGTDCQETDTAMYFNHDLEDCNKIGIEYEESNASIPLTESSIVDNNWDCEDVDVPSLKENEFDNIYDEQDGDEETIATFVTATGQQLALYAVEDSDEIYAVALYDESGEPPTNFQFLMKADVERLIGEGAVRTVKKPMQMKKRLLTTQSSVFLQKEDFEEMVEQAQADAKNDITALNMIDNDDIDQQESYETGYDYKQSSHQTYNDSATISSTSNDIIYNTPDNKQSDITTYLLMNDCPVDIDTTDESQDIESRETEENEEPMKRTTVQYILFDEDQSDSELTFDEIQKTLENQVRKPCRRLRDTSADSERSDSKSQDDYSCIKREIMRESSMGINSSLEMDITHQDEQFTSFTALTPSENESDDRQRLIDTLTGSPTTEKTQPRLKRSRKQQLTSMNRDDGEIIIQPASMLSEEELTGKKRGRRRRPRLPQVRIEYGHASSKKIKRNRRQKVVEVIDLDVDEEDQQKRNVVEITLDDSKDDNKYSSDKENEIIMVRDSDSDDEEEDDEEGKEEEEEEEEEEGEGEGGKKLSDDLTKLTDMMQCKHCSRNFRQRRALETHLRVCQKSPENAIRLKKRKAKNKREQIRKQYTCKICQEKFDVVVALARHVRAEHPQRKKHRWGPASQKTQDKSSRSVQHKQQEQEEEDADAEEDDEDEEEELSDGDDTGKGELHVLGKVKRKQKGEEDCSWEAKKFECDDCSRCFSSSALLDAHSLKHDTRKSVAEPRVHKCHICKKIMKSKLLLIRHIKLHSIRYNTDSGPSQMLRRRLRTRPSARIKSLRKRGRPRKF
ncbi:DNA ligase 1-like isoform X2 [Odontomachus brunneus]|uniref:DNA ligase 1-like isoform X2 n=1 Tax=Odontomachus brunneus TaxID=486640 RepID=UPI0013F1A85B|nr:DNA ligase 1-like isoform X2 [Odontomachus brunneus]